MAMSGRRSGFLLPAISIVAIFAITFSLYVYFRGVTEESVRATLLEQYEQRQADKTATLSKSIAADLDLLMTKLQVLAQSGPVQAGNFTGAETDLLMKRIYDESNMITRVEGIGISNSQNIVMNVYQPEIDTNQLIGQNMSSRPFVIEAKSNLPNPTFSSGYETIVNNQGQRMALLHPIYDSQDTHIGWTRSAIDASLFFERYGNISDAGSEYFLVLDRKGTILTSPFPDLEGMNIADQQAREQLAYSEAIEGHLQEFLAGRSSAAIFPEPFAETMNTGQPIVVRGQLAYFVFLSTPTSSIYSQIDGTLFVQKALTIALFAVSASAISALVVFLGGRNAVLRNSIRERTEELESASAKLESVNKELEVKNKSLEDAMAHVLEVERSKEEFVSMISHELKTPLVPMKGYSEMLLNPGVLGNLNEEQERAIKAVLKGTERLDGLVGDMLDVFKLDMNKMAFSMSRTDAKELVDRTVFDLRSIAEEKQVRLEVKIDRLMVFCDARKVEQVLANLIKNSVDFVPAEGGYVTIKAEKARTSQNTVGEEKEMAVFSVEDNGTGIPADKVDNIFKKFYQIDTGITRRHGGTGLGLVICKGIVERHGGKIWVDASYKSGACLKFTLPLA